ncbi:MAG: FAD-dependent oxidoreductase [Bifidobacteriaceae bacterium]|jgi:fumarate reductase flavoprotein subunit|nr:FAD-dependent oxidoreductase [Bifidobacteriaceae bacterium]
MGASVSRRNFLTGAGIAAAGLAGMGIAGCAPGAKDEPAADTGTWDTESDIVIVGAGGAGLAAAVVAAREGAQVTVLEAAAMAGGNTANSSGVIQAAGTEEQKLSTGITDDTPEKHAEYYLQCGEGQLDEDLVRFACEQAPSAIEFMKDLGINYEVVYGNGTIPNVDPDVIKPRIHLAGTDENDLMYGQAHIAALLKAAEDAGVEFVYNTAGSQLVQNADGVVTGVIASDNKRYHGKKAVILATCSYDRSEEFAKAFNYHMVQALKDERALTVATNKGDGLRMGMAVGAALAGMGGFIGLSNNIGGTPTLPGVPEVPGIIVNTYGRRFVSESDHYAWVLRQIFAQEDHIAWGIFDAKAAALTGAMVGGVSPMSDDFSTEIADGTVFVSDTVEGLAEQIDVPAVNLRAALDTWNADMSTAEKVDSQFPTRSCGLETIDAPPYYATRSYDYSLGALGGLKINTDGQVLDTNGDVIPHLYAAGQVAGGFMGSYYPGTGTGILSTLVFGRSAAKSALGETDA